jgi:hypothetical protein
MQLNRHYSDISLYRQPYKPWMSLTGFGAVASGQLPAMPPESAAFVEMGPTGVVTLKPQAKTVAGNYLNTQVMVPVVSGHDDDVATEDAPLEGYESWGAWLVKKLQAGAIILVGSSGGIAGFFTPGLKPKLLKAVYTDVDAAAATAAGLYAEIGRAPQGVGVKGGEKSLLAKLGPLGIAAGVVVLAGGAYLVFGKKKRHAASNRRRRRY